MLEWFWLADTGKRFALSLMNESVDPFKPFCGLAFANTDSRPTLRRRLLASLYELSLYTLTRSQLRRS